MQEPTAEQFLQNVEAWKPGPETADKIRRVLANAHTPESHAETLVKGLESTARATYQYLETIHGLTEAASIGRKDFVIQLSGVVQAMEALKAGASDLDAAFRAYHNDVQSSLQQDGFDTLYYDAIQNFDVKDALKGLLKDVDLLLKSFSLVSAQLSGVKCVELYEDCVRFHLYLQYMMLKTPLPLEECWSILFDLNNLFSGKVEGEDGDAEEDLKEFREEIEEIRRNQRN
jgi:hypothetical protein